jgi:hypothetical protein
MADTWCQGFEDRNHDAAFRQGKRDQHRLSYQGRRASARAGDGLSAQFRGVAGEFYRTAGAQSRRSERPIANPITSFRTDQRSRSNKVRDILIGPPKLPQVGGPRAPALCGGVDARNGLASAWPATPLLVPPSHQVAIAGGQPTVPDKLGRIQTDWLRVVLKR